MERVIDTLYQVILSRRENPVEGSYTAYLFEQGIDNILKKVGEECAEVIIASKNANKKEAVYESPTSFTTFSTYVRYGHQTLGNICRAFCQGPKTGQSQGKQKC